MPNANPFPTSATAGSSAGSASTALKDPNNADASNAADGGLAGSTGAALHSTIDKVADPVRSVVDRVASAAHGSVDKLASGTAQTAERLAEQKRRLQQAQASALDYSRSWVQDKPLEAVGAALALGFIIGRLTGR